MSSLSEYKANKSQLILKSRNDDSPGFPALCFQCRVFVFPWNWTVDFVGKEFEHCKEFREYVHTHNKKNLPDWHIVFDQCHIYTCSAHMANLLWDKDNHGRRHSSAWFYKPICNHKNFYLVLHQLVHVHLLLALGPVSRSSR